MSDLINLLGIGRSALLAAQRTLAVTGQNIANVNTPGYTRQEAVLATTPPVDGSPGQIGTGVAVTEIRRAVNAAVTQQLLGSHADIGRLEITQQTLGQITPLFGDTTDQGLGTALNNFFAAWQNVANNPGDVSARTALLSQAATLTSQFNQAASTLTTLQSSLNQQVSTTVAEINNLTTQIAALNQQIAQAQAGGQAPNDLLDQRDQLVSDLADRVNVTTLEDSSGQLTVFAGRGRALVSGDQAYALTTQANPDNNGLLDVVYAPDSASSDTSSSTGGSTSSTSGGGSSTGGTSQSSSVVISSELTGGSLGGLLTTRDTTIGGLVGSLNTLAASLVTQVNNLHEAGYGLDSSTGNDFFDPNGTTAATISVALTDPNQVAAAASAAGVPGDGANALAIGALQTTTLSALNDLTMTQYYAQLATNVGMAANQTNTDLQAQQVVQTQLEATQAQVSGVSLDEELVNMLAQQRAFEAASRVITMTDELLQTVLGMKQP